MLHTRDLSGAVEVDGAEYVWTLRREPQWCTVDGFKGMLVEVQRNDATGRSALLQFPATKQQHRAQRGYRDRPQVHRSELEQGIRSAIANGWSPDVRGKPFAVEL